MAKKKTSLSQTLFGEINPYAATGVSSLESTPAGTPFTLSLEIIRPDPGQPRQLLPPDLNQAVASGALLPVEALRAWLSQADETEIDSALKHNARELRRLATSIEQHGLINPITLRTPRPSEPTPRGVEYLIVTGERRYWSHVLLALEQRKIHDGNEIVAPEQIKAIIANEGVNVRAHQLIENLMREDINAVEKARGLWALRYELSGVNHGSPWPDPAELSPANQSWPVSSEPEQALVPWSRVEEILDISKRYRIFVTSVLNLCSEAQHLVVHYNLRERVIRPIVQKLKDQPELQVEALQQLIARREENETDNGPGQSIIASSQELVERLLTQAAAAPPPKKENHQKPARVISRSPETEQFRNRVQGALRFLNQLKEPDLAGLTQDLATTDEYASVVEDLRDLRERIDMILEAITIYSATRKPASLPQAKINSTYEG